MSIPRTTKLWLHDVWGSGPNDVWAVGSTETTYGSWVDPYLLHYDGTVWTDVTSTLPGYYGGGLISIWGLSANEIYVTGGGGYILKFDGSNWTEFYNMPASNGIIASGYGGKQIWGTRSTDIFILACDKPSAPQDALVYHYNDSTWTEVFSEIGLRFNSIWGSGPNDVWLAADSGDTDPERLDRLFHYNGTWGEVVLPDHEGDVVTNGNGGLYAIGGSASDNVYAVGGHGSYYYDGSTWTTLQSHCGFSVWATSPEIVFVGTYTIAKVGLLYQSSSGLPVM